MLNYVLPIAVSFLAGFQLAKDWGAHQTTWRRVVVLALIVLTGIGGAVNNYYSSRKTAKQHEEDQKQIAALKQAVDTANQNQQANTKQFVDAFGKLSQKVTDLQTQVATEALQKKLASVQLELQNTQKALAPAPKAKLFFTFVPFDIGVLGQRPATPVTDVTLPLSLDGSVHVEFAVFNPTQVEATDGQYAVIICGECKFAKEPEGFKKLDGRPETERYLPFAAVRAKAEYPPSRVDVLIPKYLNAFTIGIMYRCHTCDVPQSNEGLVGTVHVRR